MGQTPFYGARAEKKTQKADFAMKQTNICRLSGDINNESIMRWASITRIVFLFRFYKTRNDAAVAEKPRLHEFRN